MAGCTSSLEEKQNAPVNTILFVHQRSYLILGDEMKFRHNLLLVTHCPLHAQTGLQKAGSWLLDGGS